MTQTLFDKVDRFIKAMTASIWPLSKEEKPARPLQRPIQKKAQERTYKVIRRTCAKRELRRTKAATEWSAQQLQFPEEPQLTSTLRVSKPYRRSFGIHYYYPWSAQIKYGTRGWRRFTSSSTLAPLYTYFRSESPRNENEKVIAPKQEKGKFDPIRMREAYQWYHLCRRVLMERSSNEYELSQRCEPRALVYMVVHGWIELNEVVAWKNARDTLGLGLVELGRQLHENGPGLLAENNYPTLPHQKTLRKPTPQAVESFIEPCIVRSPYTYSWQEDREDRAINGPFGEAVKEYATPYVQEKVVTALAVYCQGYDNEQIPEDWNNLFKPLFLGVKRKFKPEESSLSSTTRTSKIGVQAPEPPSSARASNPPKSTAPAPVSAPAAEGKASSSKKRKRTVTVEDADDEDEGEQLPKKRQTANKTRKAGTAPSTARTATATPAPAPAPAPTPTTASSAPEASAHNQREEVRPETESQGVGEAKTNEEAASPAPAPAPTPASAPAPAPIPVHATTPVPVTTLAPAATGQRDNQSASSVDASAPQREQGATDQLTVPQQTRDSTAEHTVPQQGQSAAVEATVPQQEQSTNAEAAIPQQVQETSAEATAPQPNQPAQAQPFAWPTHANVQASAPSSVSQVNGTNEEDSGDVSMESIDAPIADVSGAGAGPATHIPAPVAVEHMNTDAMDMDMACDFIPPTQLWNATPLVQMPMQGQAQPQMGEQGAFSLANAQIQPQQSAQGVFPALSPLEQLQPQAQFGAQIETQTFVNNPFAAGTSTFTPVAGPSSASTFASGVPQFTLEGKRIKQDEQTLKLNNAGLPIIGLPKGAGPAPEPKPVLFNIGAAEPARPKTKTEERQERKKQEHARRRAASRKQIAESLHNNNNNSAAGAGASGSGNATATANGDL